MKKILNLLCVMTLFFWVAKIPSVHGCAVDESRWIDIHGSDVADNGWFELDFPDGYDADRVKLFTITLYGHNDNSSEAINIWLSFDNKINKTHTASYNVPDQADRWTDPPATFEIELNILSGDVIYRGNSTLWEDTDVGDLLGVSKESFEDLDRLWIGYGCHFWHDHTEIIVESVPIPGSVWLLCSGLAGLVAIRRKVAKESGRFSFIKLWKNF